jgi:two-component system response regulator PilR (NtrC family)
MPKRTHILVVDDELSMRQFLQIFLERKQYRVTTVESAESALSVFENFDFDLVLSDLNLPGLDGIELMRCLKEAGAGAANACPVILITAFGTAASAVEAMKEGASDYVLKPFDNEELLRTIERALGEEKLREENIQLREALQQKFWFENLVGASAAMLEVYRLIQRIKDARINCLVHGESGTGKELVARSIHFSGARRKGPFIAVNCGAIPENLIESELFGYKKGAFTGAFRNKTGFFEAASGGTLFLDEIGDMPLHAQVKVLRAISERKIVPLGALHEIPVDLRIIAASNKDLESLVAEGLFRDDLFYRLNVVRIDLPALRERHGDVELLASHFSRQFADEQGKALRGISKGALSALVYYPWPGNVRELRNAIEGAVALEEGDFLTLAALPRGIRQHAEAGELSSRVERKTIPEEGVELDSVLSGMERHFIEKALERTSGNKTQAARLLGMSFRSFRYRLAKYDLDD